MNFTIIAPEEALDKVPHEKQCDCIDCNPSGYFISDVICDCRSCNEDDEF
jgi:hypothetical protein